METQTAVLFLVGAMIWGLVQMLWSSSVARKQQGFDWGMGPRDEPRPLTGVAARLDRAYRNYLETFPVFAIALMAAIVTDRLGSLALWGAHLYLWSRIIYTPLYLAGIPLLRTVVWIASVAGIALVIAALLV